METNILNEGVVEHEDTLQVVVLEYEPDYYGDTVQIHAVVENPEHVENLAYYRGLFGDTVRMVEFNYPPINIETVRCTECDILAVKEQAIFGDLYDTPWDEEPANHWFCSAAHLDGFMGRTCCKDFNYFYCDSCGRDICEQDPTNGWHVQVRYVEDEPVCLRCYQEHIIQHGIDRESFEDGGLNGMFLDRSVIEDAGYEPIDGYVDAHIRTREDARSYCDKALKLIDDGYAVINGYERMGIGGLEGYVTMWARKSA